MQNQNYKIQATQVTLLPKSVRAEILNTTKRWNFGMFDLLVVKFEN